MTDLGRTKLKQMEQYDDIWSQKADIQYEGNRYHDHFRIKPFVAVKRLLDSQNETLDNRQVLVASCGSGIDIHYLRKFYAPGFSVTDVSQHAVFISRSLNLAVEGIVADTEALPFPDNSFDISFVAASLHHLPRPLLGLYELLRVARSGVIAIEPNDSWLMRMATRIGLATEIETAGNYVYRFSAWDIERLTRALFTKSYSISLFAIHRVAKTPLEFAVLKVLNAGANLLCSGAGNYIVWFIRKNLNLANSAGS